MVTHIHIHGRCGVNAVLDHYFALHWLPQPRCWKQRRHGLTTATGNGLVQKIH